jgi:hypothetical protein
MIISRGRNYIFVHIPKTGGTSMALALEAKAMADAIMLGDPPTAVRRRRRGQGVEARGRLWKHSTLRDVEGLVTAQEITGSFVFTMVRNPWDRVVSYYHWLRAQSFEHVAVRAAKDLSFSEFLREKAVAGPLKAQSYRTYVTAPDGTERCDLFVRLERLGEDIPKLETALGMKLGGLPWENTSARPTSAAAYSDADRDYVAELCAEDIARFEYRFPI